MVSSKTTSAALKTARAQLSQVRQILIIVDHGAKKGDNCRVAVIGPASLDLASLKSKASSQAPSDLNKDDNSGVWTTRRGDVYQLACPRALQSASPSLRRHLAQVSSRCTCSWTMANLSKVPSALMVGAASLAFSCLKRVAPSKLHQTRTRGIRTSGPTGQSCEGRRTIIVS